MKRITIFLLSCYVAFSVTAQNTSSQSNNEISLFSAQSGNGAKYPVEGVTIKQNNIKSKAKSVIFSENFSSLTLPAGWTNIDNLAGGVWEFDNPGGRVLNSTTGSTGFAIFDSDNYGNDNKPENSDLITPPIDCSGLTMVKLSFEHYFQAGWGGAGEVFVSGDNGATWTSLESWGPTSTANATYEEYNITAIAAGQSQVKIRWRWTGDYSWYWAIDDVRIFEPDAHDLAVTSIIPGTFLLSGTTIAPKVKIKNLGLNTENSYTVKLTDGAAYNHTINVTTPILPDAVYNVTFPDWSPADGIYQMTAIVNVASDANSLNDTLKINCTVGPLAEAYCGNTSALTYNKQNLSNGAQTPVGSIGSSPFPMAEDFDGINIYRIYNDMTVGTVAPDGTFTPLGTMTGVSGTPTGIAYNWTNNTWYVMVLNSSNLPQLCTLNTTTLALTLIGTGTAGMIIGMDFANDGYIYAPSINPDNLYKINPATGATTSIGPIGIDLNYGQDVSYDYNTGKLYSNTVGAQYKFGTYNLSTGAFTPISDNGGQQIATFVITNKPNSSAADIISFVFNDLTPPVSGTINTTYNTVTATVPYGTNVTALVPTIVVSPGATISPASGVAQDFSNPVMYTVTAQDGITSKIWNVTVNVASGIDNINNAQVQIFPSPAQNELYITNNDNINRIDIINIYGQILKQQTINAKEATLNISDLNNDTYFIRIYSENGIIMKKFQVLK